MRKAKGPYEAQKNIDGIAIFDSRGQCLAQCEDDTGATDLFKIPTEERARLIVAALNAYTGKGA